MIFPIFPSEAVPQALQKADEAMYWGCHQRRKSLRKNLRKSHIASASGAVIKLRLTLLQSNEMNNPHVKGAEISWPIFYVDLGSLLYISM